MARRVRTPRVGISGSYGGLNLGDEAILSGILRQLRERGDVDVTVFSRDPGDTVARHAGTKAVPVRQLSREEILPELRGLDLLILGGGGLFFDGEARIFLREAVLAQELGVPVMVYAVSAGPLKEPGNQEAVRDVLEKAAVVTVRDRKALHLLEEIGVRREIRLTADPALLLEAEPLPPGALEAEGLAARERLVGVSVREPGAAAPELDHRVYHALLANAADYIVDRLEADVVFVPMERNVLDLQHSHAVVSQMVNARRATVLKGDYTSGQVLSLIAHLDFAVGMRLHFLILSALQGVPFVALPYAPKVGGFIEELGLPSPPLEHFNAGRLIAYIDRGWDFRREIKQQIEAALPGLVERARENGRMAARLLGSRADRDEARG